jgi:hypothetical protein
MKRSQCVRMPQERARSEASKRRLQLSRRDNAWCRKCSRNVRVGRSASRLDRRPEQRTAPHRHKFPHPSRPQKRRSRPNSTISREIGPEKSTARLQRMPTRHDADQRCMTFFVSYPIKTPLHLTVSSGGSELIELRNRDARSRCVQAEPPEPNALQVRIMRRHGGNCVVRKEMERRLPISPALAQCACVQSGVASCG